MASPLLFRVLYKPYYEEKNYSRTMYRSKLLE